MRSTKHLFFLLAALLLASCSDNPVTPDPETETETETEGTIIAAHIDPVLAEQIDGYLATLPHDDAGLSVLVRHNDEIVYYGARGMGNIPTQEPLSVYSLFRLASVSKTFTAVALMQLVEQGDVGLDDSVLEYFPEFDASWAPMTVHMLLCHRAGTVDFLNDFIGSPWRRDITNQKVIDYFRDNPQLKFTPGTQAGYSNSNYVLLAEIISRVSGQPFADYMDETIFEPLGMTETYFRDTDTPLAAHETLNYAVRDTYFNIHTYTVGPMGLVGSAYEIDLFMRALANGELLNDASMALMRNPYATLFGASYGYGLMFGGDWYGHGGSLDGAQTNITFYPQRNAHLITLSNGGGRTYGYMRQVAAIVEGYY